MKSFVKLLLLALMVAAVTLGAQTLNREIRPISAERRQLNTFFSNFSEVLVEPFTQESLSDQLLIAFAIDHNYRNAEEHFERGGQKYQVKIKALVIEETVQKFFGRTINRHQSIDDRGIEYRAGWYHTTDATGEAYYFSQLEALHDTGNDTFKALVRVYTAGSGWTGDVHGSEAIWKKADPDDVPQPAERMQATLKKVTQAGKTRYILMDYVKEKS